MTIVANTYAHVVAVDTHARTHNYAVMVIATGQVANTATVPTMSPGGSVRGWRARSVVATPLLM
jgi:transposase